jgi:predicted ATPase
MLLIMDNYEHLLACPEHNRREGTGLVTEILRTATEVKIMATSRARLNVGGEHRFHVGGMDFPRPTSVATESVGDVGQYSAVRLFLQGARRALPDFALTDENLSGVIQICRLVEGMPLCIRLAAAWVEMLTPAEIAAEIGQNLNFLETDRRDVPQRQRSMRAAFDHSWRLLTERERKVLGGLSIFRGDFTREAAQQVTGGSLRELMALVNKSLLHRTPRGRSAVPELLRQYAAEKLDGSPAASQAVRDQHSAYYAAALQQWAADLRGSQQQLALAEIEADSENARAAWNWALERGQVERLEQSMDGLCRFYEWRGRYPAVIAAAQAATHLGHAVQNLSIEAVGYLWWGRALRHQGDYKEASTQLDQALARARAAQLRQVEADTLRTYGLVYWHQGGYDKARANFEQAWHICREIGDQRGAGDALNCLGAVSRNQSDYTGASTYYEQALRIYHEIGDRQGEGIVLDNLGFVSHCQGDYAGAKTYFELSLRISREIGDPEVEGDVLAYLGLLSHHLGDDEAARKYSQQALLIAQDLGDRRTQGYALTNLGHALVGLGRLVEAADAYRQALGLRRELGQSNLAMEPLAGLARVSLAQGDLPQRQVEEILSHLENQTPSTALRLRSGQGSGHGLDGTDEPFWVYLTCYRVLCANQDPRAEAILGTAHSLLQEQAAKISDEELRRSFLENVATHREVMCEFVKMSSGLIAGAKAY